MFLWMISSIEPKTKWLIRIIATAPLFIAVLMFIGQLEWATRLGDVAFSVYLTACTFIESLIAIHLSKRFRAKVQSVRPTKGTRHGA